MHPVRRRPDAGVVELAHSDVGSFGAGRRRSHRPRHHLLAQHAEVIGEGDEAAAAVQGDASPLPRGLVAQAAEGQEHSGRRRVADGSSSAPVAICGYAQVCQCCSPGVPREVLPVPQPTAWLDGHASRATAGMDSLCRRGHRWAPPGERKSSVRKRHLPRLGDGTGLPGLLVVIATSVLAAQSQAWASAVVTAAAVYGVITAHQD